MQELIDAIVANPDDDLPRLVYADWLEENDQYEYAQWLRDSLVNRGSWQTRRGNPAVIVPDGVTEIEIAPGIENLSWVIKRGFPAIAYLYDKIPENTMNQIRSTLPIKFEKHWLYPNNYIFLVATMARVNHRMYGNLDDRNLKRLDNQPKPEDK